MLTTIVVVLVVLLAVLPTTIVLAVGLVPTLVAYIVDITPGRYACRCVAGLNIAGVAPSVHTLWIGRNDLDTALAIITDPLAWLTFYVASALGWMLFIGVPNAVSTVQTLNAKRRVNLLRDTQKRLVHEWGVSIKPETSRMMDPAADEDASAPGDRRDGRDRAGGTEKKDHGDPEDGTTEAADT